MDHPYRWVGHNAVLQETVHFQRTTFQVQSKVTNIQFNYYLSKYGTKFHLMLTQQN